MAANIVEDPEGPSDDERIHRLRKECDAWFQLRGAADDLDRSLKRFAKAAVPYLELGKRDAWDAITGLGHSAGKVLDGTESLLKDLDKSLLEGLADVSRPREAGVRKPQSGDGPGKETEES